MHLKFCGLFSLQRLRTCSRYLSLSLLLLLFQLLSLLSRKSIFKYKVTYFMQTDSKSAVIFLSFDMHFNGKRLNKLEHLTTLNFISINLMFSARQTHCLPVY